MTNLEIHFIQQSILPTPDKEQWLAFLTLKQRYKQLTWLSMDGYSCDGIADYSKNLYWQDRRILDWTDKSVIKETEKKFWEYTTSEICSIWMQVNGETLKTKTEWVWSLK